MDQAEVYLIVRYVNNLILFDNARFGKDSFSTDPSLPGPSTNGAGAIHGPGQNYNGHLVSPVHGTVSGPQARQVAAQGAGLFNCIR